MKDLINTYKRQSSKDAYLKAIELREKLLLTKKDSLDLLVEEMSKPLTYRCSDDKVLIYKRFLSDIECKR